jgi:hypothetical protein
MQANRWGSTSVAEIITKIDEIMPKNRKKAKDYGWHQFMDFVRLETTP